MSAVFSRNGSAKKAALKVLHSLQLFAKFRKRNKNYRGYRTARVTYRSARISLHYYQKVSRIRTGQAGKKSGKKKN